MAHLKMQAGMIEEPLLLAPSIEDGLEADAHALFFPYELQIWIQGFPGCQPCGAIQP